ncbi:MAG: efflux RND transporter periplasmic adaptor subunit [Elusimicrobiota bacterium]|jgi:Cu(I)/Ag(I) efflux system membrane fusion protein
MKRMIFIALIILTTAGVLTFTTCQRSSEHSHSAKVQKQQYHCPMHPTVITDKPGDCPICGMRLVPIESQEARDAAIQQAGGTNKSGERKILFYRSPMQPGMTSPVPKKDDMGMDYVPVYSDEQSAATPVSGYAAVSIPANREQLIGVRVAPVERRDLTFLIRASGRVAYDPDLYSASAEHQEALIAREKTKDSPWPDVHQQAEALVDASTLRLRQMGLSQSQITELGVSSGTQTNLLLGQPGGKVWVYAQIYEYESGLVREGQPVEVLSSAIPGRRFWGKVRAVDSILNSETRSLRVRTEIPNENGLLKPEMYVDAVIHVTLGKRLAIPAEALLDTGTRQIVFVMTGPGKYEPREVRVGHEAEGYYEVLSGVKEGDQVVASANFLIDSESKLKAAISDAGGGHRHGQ